MQCGRASSSTLRGRCDIAVPGGSHLRDGTWRSRSIPPSGGAPGTDKACGGGLGGRLLERLEEDDPAPAVGSGTAGERRGECEVERRDLPPLLGATRVHRDAERFQQIVGRLM